MLPFFPAAFLSCPRRFDLAVPLFHKASFSRDMRPESTRMYEETCVVATDCPPAVVYRVKAVPASEAPSGWSSTLSMADIGLSMQ